MKYAKVTWMVPSDNYEHGVIYWGIDTKEEALILRWGLEYPQYVGSDANVTIYK